MQITSPQTVVALQVFSFSSIIPITFLKSELMKTLQILKLIINSSNINSNSNNSKIIIIICQLVKACLHFSYRFKDKNIKHCLLFRFYKELIYIN